MKSKPHLIVKEMRKQVRSATPYIQAAIRELSKDTERERQLLEILQLANGCLRELVRSGPVGKSY